jgi:hypothetical protein
VRRSRTSVYLWFLTLDGFWRRTPGVTRLIDEACSLFEKSRRRGVLVGNPDQD